MKPEADTFFLVPTETTAKTAESYRCSTDSNYSTNSNWTPIVYVIRCIKSSNEQSRADQELKTKWY